MYAQDKGQFKPYNNAITLMKKQQFEQAIPPLQQAISVDAVPGNKRYEASLTQDYYPQYYLFICYVKLKQYDKARPFANAARPGKPEVPDFQSAKNEYDQAQATALAAANASANAAAEEKKKADTLAANTTKFNDAFGRAESALAARRWDDAIAAYNEAKGILPDEFAKRGGDGKIKSASDGKTAAANALADQQRKADFERIMNGANTALGSKNYGVAITALNEAKSKYPNDFNAAQGQSKLDQALKEQKATSDLADFNSDVAKGDAAMNAKNWAEAQNAYNSAKAKLPGEFGNRKLQGKLDQAAKEIDKMGADAKRTAEFTAAMNSANGAIAAKKWDEAIKQLEAARAKSPDDFRKNNLQAKLDEANKQKNAPPPAAGGGTAPATAAVDFEKTARDGLTALFAGDLKTAEQILSLAHTAAKASPAQKALAHAYLGVVYAEIALQSKGDVKAKNESRAKEEYRQAGNFSFPKRIISPAVLNMLSAKGSN